MSKKSEIPWHSPYSNQRVGYPPQDMEYDDFEPDDQSSCHNCHLIKDNFKMFIGPNIPIYVKGLLCYIILNHSCAFVPVLTFSKLYKYD